MSKWDNLQVQYAEFPLDAVMRAYAKELVAPEGFKMSGLMQPSWFIDQTKGVVIFKCYTEREVKICPHHD